MAVQEIATRPVYSRISPPVEIAMGAAQVGAILITITIAQPVAVIMLSKQMRFAMAIAPLPVTIPTAAQQTL